MAFRTFLLRTFTVMITVFIFLTEHCDYGFCDCNWLYKTLIGRKVDINYVTLASLIWHQNSRSTILL